MLRLADRIVMNWSKDSGAKKFVSDVVCQSPVFIADELARAFINAERCGRGGLIDTGERIPCESFDGFSGLHKLPDSTIFVEGFSEHEWSFPEFAKYGKSHFHFGALAIEQDVPDAWHYRDYLMSSELREEYTWSLQKGSDFRPAFITKVFGVRYRKSKGGSIEIDSCLDILFDRDGKPYPFIVDHYFRWDRKPEYRNLYPSGLGWNPAILMVLTINALLNCSNVETREAEEFSMPDKWHRRTKTPRLIYKVLQISRSRKSSKSGSSCTETGEASIPLHTCRGHFKTYKEDKPLFGRTVGTVWCPSHVRGDIKHGAVIKDYEVKTNG